MACAGGRMWCRISVQVYNELSGERSAEDFVPGQRELHPAVMSMRCHSVQATETCRGCPQLPLVKEQHDTASSPAALSSTPDYQKLADAVKQLAAAPGDAPGAAPAVPTA